MVKKQSRKLFNIVDAALLCLSAIFLVSTIIRTGNAGSITRLREQLVTFVEGKISVQEVVRAFGDWEKMDTAVAAVFNSNPGGVEEDTYEKMDSDRFEQDVLLRQTTLFPDIVDQLVYPIELSHKTPAEGILTSGFGERNDPLDQEAAYHYGVDIAADEGEAIYSVADGYVMETGDNSYGKYVILNHENGLQTLYAHCSAIEVVEGEWVEGGEKIAAVGMTGRATGNHLHFELWRAGKILDPMHYIEV